jgi:integrase/recombinase XerD
MLEELQRRNYAETTISSYIRIVEDFSRRFQRPPDRLGPQQIREYQAELFKKRKLTASTVTVYLAALRFFYTKTLKKGWSAAETPYPKRAEHVPSIPTSHLSGSEPHCGPPYWPASVIFST